MRYNRLGRTGLLVSELCLGTMTFGGGGGMWEAMGALPLADAQPLFKAALDAGVNFIDTADVYSNGISEEITGQSIRNLGVKREEVVIATKVFGQMWDGPNGRGLSRQHIMEAAKASLRRLGTDYIDLYQLHGFDAATPIEETLRALHTLVEHGHVRYIGVSNWAAWQIMKALGLSERLGLHRFASLQAYYTVAGRDLEREIAPMLLSEEVGLMVWSPLAGGLLSGKYDAEGGATDARRAQFDFPPVDRDRAAAAIAAMRPIADAHGVSVARVALAWLLAQPAVTSIIVGAKRMEQLADNLAAAELTLSAEELETLGAATALAAEYPGWMLDWQGRNRSEQLAASKR